MRRILPVVVFIAFFGGVSCSSVRKIGKAGVAPARISLPEVPKTVDFAGDAPAPDTLVIRNIDGREMIVMKTVRDEDGSAVANQVLAAAKVTASFCNVADRHGKVDIGFKVTVPRELQMSRWQIRYTPTMFMLSDSLKLDKVIITGREYRRRQMRGYQLYQRFLDRIVSDSTMFIRKDALEIFLRRNIPQLYAFKSDTSFVSEEGFLSAFGVDEAQAMDHYTDRLARSINERRKRNREKYYRRYVKAPIQSEGVRLDTVILNADGDWEYNYTQTVATRPHMKRVDIVLDGEIFEQDQRVCTISRSAPLNYYISSVSAFVDDTPRYVTRIIERSSRADVSYRIDFRAGRSEVEPSLGTNAGKIAEVKANIASLMDNAVFELDSIAVTASASPEGPARANAILSKRRSESIVRYFKDYVRSREDSLRKEAGISLEVGYDGSVSAGGKVLQEHHGLKFSAHYKGEDWPALDSLVVNGSGLSREDLLEYDRFARTMADEDRRERAMSARPWYTLLRQKLYPQLRKVDFTFHMHRRGMVRDTVHTTVLDSLYLEGVQAIKDREYAKAVEILRPYNDYNTAVAYCAMDFNHSALAILRQCPYTPAVGYMLALLYARLGDAALSVQYYIRCCGEDPKYVHRGNLDPEINNLIKQYNLNQENF